MVVTAAKWKGRGVGPARLSYYLSTLTKLPSLAAVLLVPCLERHFGCRCKMFRHKRAYAQCPQRLAVEFGATSQQHIIGSAPEHSTLGLIDMFACKQLQVHGLTQL